MRCRGCGGLCPRSPGCHSCNAITAEGGGGGQGKGGGEICETAAEGPRQQLLEQLLAQLLLLQDVLWPPPPCAGNRPCSMICVLEFSLKGCQSSAPTRDVKGRQPTMHVKTALQYTALQQQLPQTWWLVCLDNRAQSSLRIQSLLDLQPLRLLPASARACTSHCSGAEALRQVAAAGLPVEPRWRGSKHVL